MHLDKDTIVSYLRTRGEHGKADEAERELPQDVDHQAQGSVLSRLGVPAELLVNELGDRPKLPRRR